MLVCGGGVFFWGVFECLGCVSMGCVVFGDFFSVFIYVMEILVVFVFGC